MNGDDEVWVCVEEWRKVRVGWCFGKVRMGSVVVQSAV